MATGSSKQAGVPALTSAKAELNAAFAGVIEVSYAAHLLKHVGEIVTGTSAFKSILTRPGPGRSKHLEALQLYLQENARSGELSVKEIPGTLNPADVVTKFIDDATLERHLETLVWVNLECMSGTKVGIRENVHAGR